MLFLRIALILGLSAAAQAADAGPRRKTPEALKSKSLADWPNHIVIGEFDDERYRPIGDFNGLLKTIQVDRKFACEPKALRKDRSQFEFACDRPETKDRIMFLVTYQDTGQRPPRYILSKPSENAKPLTGGLLQRFYLRLWLGVATTEL